MVGSKEEDHLLMEESSVREINNHGSLGITISKSIAKALGLTKEDSIEIYVPKDNPEKAEIKKKQEKKLKKNKNNKIKQPIYLSLSYRFL